MIQIKKAYTYEDTEENILFWATSKGYQPTLTRQIEVVDDDTTEPPTVHFETEEYPNPESVESFCVRYFDELIKKEITSPIKAQVEKSVREQLEADFKANIETLTAQKESEVLSRLRLE
jgi:hypothetical protein